MVVQISLQITRPVIINRNSYFFVSLLLVYYFAVSLQKDNRHIYVNTKLYANKPQSIEQLKENIRDIVAKMSIEICLEKYGRHRPLTISPTLNSIYNCPVSKILPTYKKITVIYFILIILMKSIVHVSFNQHVLQATENINYERKVNMLIREQNIYF